MANSGHRRDSPRPIYLDHQATTPVDPRVLAAMLPYFTEHFGNPTSTTHQYGWAAEAAVTSARASIAAAIGASPEEIVFTSGATEANNLAIKGIAEAYLSKGQHLITLQTEHNAVLDPCQYLESVGFRVTYLPVNPDGLIDLDQLQAAICPDTILVSIMAANNEIGVLQPLAEIGKICRERAVLFHTDAAQAIGKIRLDVDLLKIDLMSLTAHKVYGPKGIGALYIRRHQPRVTIAPQLHGGGHEQGRRSGTLYPPQIVGFAQAIDLALADLDAETDRLTQLRDRLWSQLSQVEGIYLNGHPTQRLAGNLNISVAGVEGTALLMGLRSIVALSSGAACSSAQNAPSHVLLAIGRSKSLADAALRFGIGHTNTVDEIDRVAQATIETIQNLRKLALRS
jgi:cysteine desulfurase